MYVSLDGKFPTRSRDCLVMTRSQVLDITPRLWSSLAAQHTFTRTTAQQAMAAPINRWGWSDVSLGDLMELSVVARAADETVLIRLQARPYRPSALGLSRRLWRAMTRPSMESLYRAFVHAHRRHINDA